MQACLEKQFGHTPSPVELQNLKSLTCANEKLTDQDIVELSQLTQLTELNLTGNRFTDISPLNALTQLNIA